MNDPFTTEQRKLWDDLKLSSASPTSPQEAVSSFKYLCGFEGIEKPSTSAIQEVLRNEGKL